MQPIQFFAARHEDGALLPGATIDVYLKGTQTRATLFSDDNETPLGNPAYADESAKVFIYTSAERVDIQISKGGYVAPLMRGILVVDVTETLAEMQELTADAEAAKDDAVAAAASVVDLAGAAQVYAEVYDTIALGRAAVADTEYFKVIPGGSDALVRLSLFRRDSGSTQTLVDSYAGGDEVTGLSNTLAPIAETVTNGGAAFKNLDVLESHADADGREYLRFEGDGSLIAKLAISVDVAGQANGLSFERNADGSYTLSYDGGQSEDAFNNLDVAFWVVDPDYKILFEVPTSGYSVPDVEDNTAEIEAARGDRNELNDRIAEFLSSYGAPKSPMFGAETLRNTRLKLAQLQSGSGVRFVANLGQDSYTQVSGGWSSLFATRMFGLYPDGGAGWIGFGGIGAFANDNIRPSDYPVVLSGFERNQTLSVFSTHSPDLGFAHSSTSGHTITVTIAATPIHSELMLYFEKTTSGALNVSVDGGAVQSVDCSGDGLGKVSLTGIPVSGSYDIVIANADNNHVRVCGIYAESVADGVMINKIASAGSRITRWTEQDPTSQELWMTDLQADLWIWLGGPNEQGASLAADSYATEIGNWIDTIRTHQPEADIAIVVAPENARVNSVDMADYASALRDVAWQKSVYFRNLQSSFGRAPANYSDANPNLKLLAADLLHPSGLGHVIIADVFSRDLIPTYEG